LQQLNIPCYYVTGYAGQNHAWNIVKLDDGYYNVDATWDDTNPATYDYFNCSDADYDKTHIRQGLSIYLPACMGNKYSGLEVKPAQTTTTTTPAPTQPATTTITSATDSTTTQPTTTDKESITVITTRGGGDANYIDSIGDYFNECFAAMIDNDNSSQSFSLTVVDKALWDEIYKAYDNGDCQEGYIDRYLVEKHKNSAKVTVTATPMSDGSYLLSHTVTIN
jgi:hypothetical protein